MNAFRIADASYVSIVLRPVDEFLCLSQEDLRALQEEECNLEHHVQNVHKSMQLLLEDPLHKVR